MDVVVTVPKSFGLSNWIDEGDAAGEPWSGTRWVFTAYGHAPSIGPGDSVYVVYNGKLRGYAPLIELTWNFEMFGGLKPTTWQRWGFVRGGGGVAVTIPEVIIGFRGWRYRWWDRAIEVPFHDWKTP